MKKTTSVLVAIFLLLPLIASAKDVCITSSADSLFEALRPLTKSCKRVGPVSARWYLNATLWNSLSYDQQQQLMDEAASKAVIQSARVAIHIYVLSTEVGEIGPGWSGEWKFRRKKH